MARGRATPAPQDAGERVAVSGCDRWLSFALDLSRAAGAADLLTRAISGHAIEAMQRHYSTAAADEMRDGLAKVIDIAIVRWAA